MNTIVQTAEAPAPAAQKLTRVLRQIGHNLGRDVLAALPPQGRTIANDLLIHRLITHLSGALATGEDVQLLGWIRRHCQHTADLTSLRAATTAVLERISEVLLLVETEIVPPQEIARYRALADEVCAVVSAARTRFVATESQSVDETDVELEHLILQLDRTDPATAEHSRAVAAWCRRIGARLGLPLAEVVHVARGGLIHDIGKLETPLQILLAPRRLNAREFELMQQHVMSGIRILDDHPSLTELVPIVRSHHERVDGRGYPDGVPSTELPLAVRIVTVADSFNAMIGVRPYRSPLLPTSAIEELRRHRGAQFDPEIVDAMLAVVLETDEMLSKRR